MTNPDLAIIAAWRERAEHYRPGVLLRHASQLDDEPPLRLLRFEWTSPVTKWFVCVSRWGVENWLEGRWLRPAFDRLCIPLIPPRQGAT